jgi:hypothetical protein
MQGFECMLIEAEAKMVITAYPRRPEMVIGFHPATFTGDTPGIALEMFTNREECVHFIAMVEAWKQHIVEQGFTNARCNFEHNGYRCLLFVTQYDCEAMIDTMRRALDFSRHGSSRELLIVKGGE